MQNTSFSPLFCERNKHSSRTSTLILSAYFSLQSLSLLQKLRNSARALRPPVKVWFPRPRKTASLTRNVCSYPAEREPGVSFWTEPPSPWQQCPELPPSSRASKPGWLPTNTPSSHLVLLRTTSAASQDFRDLISGDCALLLQRAAALGKPPRRSSAQQGAARTTV